jgi:hypothetical protein
VAHAHQKLSEGPVVLAFQNGLPDILCAALVQYIDDAVVGAIEDRRPPSLSCVPQHFGQVAILFQNADGHEAVEPRVGRFFGDVVDPVAVDRILQGSPLLRNLRIVVYLPAERVPAFHLFRLCLYGAVVLKAPVAKPLPNPVQQISAKDLRKRLKSRCVHKLLYILRIELKILETRRWSPNGFVVEFSPDGTGTV